MPKKMVILLHGPDTYRSGQKLKEIIEHYKKNHQSLLNLRNFDSESNNLPELLDWLKQASIFKEKKLAVLKNFWKFFKDFKKFIRPNHIVLFFEKGLVRGKVPEAVKAQKFDFLSGLALKAWVKKEFVQFGAKPAPGAAEKLIEFVGSDSWALANEIKKLAAYKKRAWARLSLAQAQEGGEVLAEDIEGLVRPKIDADIFKTIDAVAKKNKNLALNLLQKHLQKGDSPLYLLAMINYQFRNLILVKSDSSAKLKLHPYVARKTEELARRFAFEELKKIYRKIFEADVNIKTGKIGPETALTLLISEIL